jgi:hypothetical protein
LRKLLFLWATFLARRGLDLGRLELTHAYLTAIGRIRQSASHVAHLLMLVGVMVAGVLVMLAGLALVLPLPRQLQGVVLLSIGALFTGIGAWGYLVLNSEKKWKQVTHADALIPK